MLTFKRTTTKTAVLFAVLTLLASAGLWAQTKVVKIKGLNSMRFSKTTITAHPGQKITVKLTAVSDLPANAMSHDFVLLKNSADPQTFVRSSVRYRKNGYIDPNLTDQTIAYTDMASGGETVQVTFKAPQKSGRYIYLCTFPGHFQSGMKGTFIVK